MIGDTIRELHSALPSNVALVAVSKFHPLEAVLEAYDAGQRVFAESRPQELQQKVRDLDGRAADIRWHFIGHLQTNKLKMVLPYVELVQSVDSLRLLEAIRSWAAANGKKVRVLLELHVAAEESKQGFGEEEVLSIISAHARAAGTDPVEICGLMAMATNTEDEDVIRRDFSAAHDIWQRIRNEYPELEEFRELSIGMSGDYPIALEYGSTMVRIGTRIFGSRQLK